MIRMIEITKETGTKENLALTSNDFVELNQDKNGTSLEIREMVNEGIPLDPTFKIFWNKYIGADPKSIKSVSYLIDNTEIMSIENIDYVSYTLQDLKDSNMNLVPGVAQKIKIVIK